MTASGKMAGDRFDIVVPQRRNALRTATRHSARVKFLRWAIIIGATLTTAFIGIIAFFDPFKHLPLGVSVSSVKLDGTRVTTMDPKFTGFRKDGRAYQVIAKSASQDILDTNVTDLVGVNAKVVMGDDSTARITAAYGVHDSLHDKIKLRENVHIRNVTGYEFLLKSLNMNFNTSEMKTDEPATLLLNGARFDADKMTITDNGNKVTFEGSVKSIIDQDSQDTSVGALMSIEK